MPGLSVLLTIGNEFTCLIISVVLFAEKRSRLVLPGFLAILFTGSVLSADDRALIKCMFYLLFYSACLSLFDQYSQKDLVLFVRYLFYSIAALIIINSFLNLRGILELFDIMNHKSYFSCILVMTFFSLDSKDYCLSILFLACLLLAMSKLACIASILLSISRFTGCRKAAILLFCFFFLAILFHAESDNILRRGKFFIDLQFLSIAQFRSNAFSPKPEGEFYTYCKKENIQYRNDTIRHSHNSFSNMLAEKGILGLVIYVLLCLEFYRYFFRAGRIRTEGFDPRYLLGTLLIYNFLDFVLYNFAVSVLVISFLALIDSASRRTCCSSLTESQISAT